MNASITRIEPLNLTQDTAVGRGTKRKGVNWYIFPIHLVDDITGWEATADASAHIGHRSALGSPQFVCEVFTPVITLGSPDEIREDIRRAVLKHAVDLKLID